MRGAHVFTFVFARAILSLSEISGIDFTSLVGGSFYLILPDKKTIVGTFKSLKELTQKTGISADNAKFRNKEYTLLIPFSSLDLDPSLRQTVEPLASKGIIKVYLVSPPDVTY